MWASQFSFTDGKAKYISKQRTNENAESENEEQTSGQPSDFWFCNSVMLRAQNFGVW
jgi:hypothetical protein